MEYTAFIQDAIHIYIKFYDAYSNVYYKDYISIENITFLEYSFNLFI